MKIIKLQECLENCFTRDDSNQAIFWLQYELLMRNFVLNSQSLGIQN